MEIPEDIFDCAGAREWVSACPEYAPSPLSLVSPAEFEGRRVWLKDESRRMNLGSFKALGGVYAIARIVARETGGDIGPAALASEDARRVASRLCFVTASAGNHGLSVAAGARIFGASSRIHIAETVAEAFALRLRAQGAEVLRSGEIYEDSLAAAAVDAKRIGAIHLTDTSWPGSVESVRLIMEGYTILAGELEAAFTDSGEWPSRVYLQAGVGGLAAAIAWSIRQSWDIQPEITVVEPDRAACLQASVAAGKLVTVAGPVSNMGRLDCKTPSSLAFDILKSAADRFVTVSDEEAELAARRLATLDMRGGIASTPSGTAGLAACLREDGPGTPLVIISEGDPGNGES
ncbi:MAG: pyridoxal-phosphate dependent enzyme [Gammaproteobacteria bacterium]|nr:pyridoxal-phosphate dependent enzyme [Gammaproteobacteria bacterium]